MAYYDSWTDNDFYEELLAIMDGGLFSDVNDVLDVETRLLNGQLTETDKKRIAHQDF